MGSKVQLNYDELRTIVKKFRNEGEDIIQLHSVMRDRVHDLRKDWVGEGADKFFNEMEYDLLPALTRLSRAIFYAQDVLHKIIQTIRSYDEDTAGYFKSDFAHVVPINLGAFVSAGIGVGIGSVVGGSLAGGLSSAQGTGVGGQPGGEPSGVGPGVSIGGTGEQSPDIQAGIGPIGSVDQTPGAGGQGQGVDAGYASGAQTAGTNFSPGGGAGGGSTGGGATIPDHIYDASSGGGAGGSGGQTSQGTGSGGGGTQGSTGGGEGAAAGAAGAAGGAAIGGAGKAIKGKLRKKKR